MEFCAEYFPSTTEVKEQRSLVRACLGWDLTPNEPSVLPWKNQHLSLLKHLSPFRCWIFPTCTILASPTLKNLCWLHFPFQLLPHFSALLYKQNYLRDLLMLLVSNFSSVILSQTYPDEVYPTTPDTVPLMVTCTLPHLTTITPSFLQHFLHLAARNVLSWCSSLFTVHSFTLSLAGFSSIPWIFMKSWKLIPRWLLFSVYAHSLLEMIL